MVAIPMSLLCEGWVQGRVGAIWEPPSHTGVGDPGCHQPCLAHPRDPRLSLPSPATVSPIVKRGDIARQQLWLRCSLRCGATGPGLAPGALGQACASASPLSPRPLQTSCLQYLDARNTPLLDHSAPFVARALRIRSSLAVLHLENASLSGRPLMLLGEPQAREGEWDVRPAGGRGRVPDLGRACPVTVPPIPSHGPEDEHEPAGAVPGGQQAQWPAGLGPAG